MTKISSVGKKRVYFRVLLRKLDFQDGIPDNCISSRSYQGKEIVGITRNCWYFCVFRMFTAFNQ